MDERRKPEDEEEDDERDRRATNIFLLVAAVVVIAAGIWLVNAMVDLKKRTECAESGRPNCNPIEVDRDQR